MKRPFIVNLLLLLSCLATMVLFYGTIFFALLFTPRSTTALPISLILIKSLFVYLTFLLTLLTIGLFRFRRWAVVSVGMFATFLALHALASLIFIRQEHTRIWPWIWFSTTSALSLYVLIKVNFQMGKFEPPRMRPFGINVLVGFSCISWPLYPLVFLIDFYRHAPSWQFASDIFNFALYVSIAWGLWMLQEWGRILAEIVSYLGPLIILPSLLGTNNNKPVIIAVAAASLVYEVWAILYLKDPDVVKAFVS